MTLTKPENREIGRKPPDEQFHVLPLYRWDPCSEDGTLNGIGKKLKSGAIEVGLIKNLRRISVRSSNGTKYPLMFFGVFDRITRKKVFFNFSDSVANRASSSLRLYKIKFSQHVIFRIVFFRFCPAFAVQCEYVISRWAHVSKEKSGKNAPI